MSRIIKNPYKGQHSKPYKAEFSVGSGRLRKRSTKNFATKRAATSWIHEMELKQGNSLVANQAEMLLSDWFSLWFKTFKQPVVAPSTRATYEATQKLLEKYLPNVKMIDLSTVILQHAVNLMGKSKAKETLRKVVSQLKGCLAEAYQQGVIIRNPASRLTIPVGIKTRSKKERVMSKKEYQKLRAYLEQCSVTTNNLNSIVLLVISQTALRVGEALALELNDIDFERHLVKVRRSFDTCGKESRPPKTSSGYRDILISETLCDTLAVWIKVHDRTLTNTNTSNPKKMLFLKKNGEMPLATSINKTYHRIQKELKFKGRYTTHTLRHFLASSMIGSGEVSVVYVSQFLGHSSSSITQQYYLGLVPDDQNRQDQQALSVIAGL